MAHKAPTKSPQRSLSCAILDASLQVRPSLPFSSASTDLLHVNHGLPRLRLPSGVQNRASLVMSSFWGFLRTWPIQLYLLLASSTMMSSWLNFALTLLLLLLLLWVISLEIFQLSEPYNRSVLTFELKSLILVFKDITVDLHTGFSDAKASSSESVPPFSSMMLPRQANLLTVSICWPFTSTVIWLVGSIPICLVFFVLIFRPIFPELLLRCSVCSINELP